MATLLNAAIAPLLVAATTLACGRWGARAGGTVSAFPAIVGPVLLIEAQQHGAAFAARSATATLLGLVAMSAFVLCYALMARRAGWRASFLIAWSTAGALAVPLGRFTGHSGVLGALLLATVSLVLARRALPRPADAVPRDPGHRPRDLATRMGLTALLVVSLAAAAGAAGPLVGGMLAALPVLASILAVFTHRERGAGAAIALLDGMLSGMSAFVSFCAVVAALVVPLGVAVTFGVATLVAVGMQVSVGLRHAAWHPLWTT